MNDSSYKQLAGFLALIRQINVLMADLEAVKTNHTADVTNVNLKIEALNEAFDTKTDVLGADLDTLGSKTDVLGADLEAFETLHNTEMANLNRKLVTLDSAHNTDVADLKEMIDTIELTAGISTRRDALYIHI